MPVPLIVAPSVDEMNPVFSQGDIVTITYDGGQVLTVYLPYMDGSMEWDNLFVATDGSTYFYYDTITHSHAALDYLISLVGADRAGRHHLFLY